jgi:hypothetical protein
MARFGRSGTAFRDNLLMKRRPSLLERLESRIKAICRPRADRPAVGPQP